MCLIVSFEVWDFECWVLRRKKCVDDIILFGFVWCDVSLFVLGVYNGYIYVVDGCLMVDGLGLFVF